MGKPSNVRIGALGAHGTFWLPIEELSACLRQQGLHLVTDADQRVLEAATKLTTEGLKSFGTGGTNWQRFAQAELARRGD